MRLIDADALKEEFTCKGDEWINNIIDSEPTIDAVSVVRCKECKYWEKPWKDNGEIVFGKYCNIGHGVECDADDFCSYGERSDT